MAKKRKTDNREQPRERAQTGTAARQLFNRNVRNPNPAQRRAAAELPGVLKQPSVTNMPRRSYALESEPLPEQQAGRKPTADDLAGSRYGLDMRQASTCKQKPTNTKGKGGSRPFVPWCDRKK